MRLDKQRTMQELGIPEDMYNELLQVFIEQTEGALKNLYEGLRKQNYEEIAKAAHFIKGSAGNLRLDEIYQLSKGIEAAAKDNTDIKIIEVNIRQLKIRFEELCSIVGKKEDG